MPLNNFGMVGPHLYRSAQPVTDDAYITMAHLGITMTYKLNGDLEYPRALEIKKLQEYRPEIKTAVVHDEEVAALNPDRSSVIRAARQLFQIVELMDHDEGLLVHCTHGLDRTGAVVGAYRILFDDWKLEAVLNELESYGVHGIIRLAGTGIIEVLRRIKRMKDKGEL